MAGIYIGLSKDGSGQALSYSGENHLITIGPPGTGKSTSLLMPNLASLKRSILVIDPKGELAAVTAQKRAAFGRVVVLNPFGVLVDECPYLKSHGFNPLALLDPDSDDFVDDASAIGEGLVKIQGKDPHWTEGGQDFVTALIMYVRRLGGTTADLGIVRKLLTESRSFDHEKNPQGLESTIFEMRFCGYTPIEQKAGRFAADNNEMGSLVSAAISQTKFLDSPPIVRDLSSGGGFDFRSMRDEIVTVYLILPIDRMSTHANWFRLIIAAALRSLMDAKNTRFDQTRPPVLFMLDEFAQLGHMSSIEDAMSAARGSRLQLWPILQDLTQLKKIYGETWENFLGTAGFCSFFTPRTMVTANYISERGKSHERPTQSKTSGDDGRASRTVSTVVEPVYRPEFFLDMKKGNQVSFTEFVGEAQFLEAPHYNDKRLSQWCSDLAQNPYYRTASRGGPWDAARRAG